MEKAGKIARLTLGLLMIIFGINAFTGFMGERILPEIAGIAIRLIESLAFVKPLMASLAILSGLMLLADLLVPVAVTVALILIIAVLSFHVMYHPRGMMYAVLAFLAAIAVVYDYRREFRQMLRRDK
jgi:putative oxidoreductase